MVCNHDSWNSVIIIDIIATLRPEFFIFFSTELNERLDLAEKKEKLKGLNCLTNIYIFFLIKMTSLRLTNDMSYRTSG